MHVDKSFQECALSFWLPLYKHTRVAFASCERNADKMAIVAQ